MEVFKRVLRLGISMGGTCGYLSRESRSAGLLEGLLRIVCWCCFWAFYGASNLWSLLWCNCNSSNLGCMPDCWVNVYFGARFFWRRVLGVFTTVWNSGLMTRPHPPSDIPHDSKISPRLLAPAIPSIATMRLDTVSIMSNGTAEEKPYNVSIIGFYGFILF